MKKLTEEQIDLLTQLLESQLETTEEMDRYNDCKDLLKWCNEYECE